MTGKKSHLVIFNIVFLAALILPLAPGLAAERTALSDSRIAPAVERELEVDPGVHAGEIEVAVSGGIVTLTGTVPDILTRTRSTRVAETVRGVRSVVNNLEVQAPLRSDTEILLDVRTVLLSNPATESFEVRSNVERGRVILNGSVDSWQEKKLVGTLAKSVRGVRGLDNRLTVEYDGTRTDTEILNEITYALRWDARVEGAQIEVDVQNGTVVLEGNVGSAAELRVVKNLANVRGVKTVKTDRLEVRDLARAPLEQSPRFHPRSDTEITDALKRALLIEPRVPVSMVEITVNNGIVRLEGSVPTLAASREATRIAHNTEGVLSVENRIDVEPEPVPPDTIVLERVEKALQRHPLTDAEKIRFVIDQGEVFLGGIVSSKQEKRVVEDVVAGVNGVRQVFNMIDVENDLEAVTYDPYVDDDIPVSVYDWTTEPRPVQPVETDWEIREEIENQIYWSPFVDHEEVAVRVKNGIAILEGIVDSPLERQRAEDNAYEGGAILVRNRLQVSSMAGNKY